MKVFKYSSVKRTLATNQRHNFALKHTLAIYQSESAYTFIPKNACSTLRYSIAKANGCIGDIGDIEWIHSNNSTFAMSTETAYKAKYKFVILRCPFSRLFSSYMDKMVNMDIQAWKYRNIRNRIFHPHDLTFEYFIKDLGIAPLSAFDIHWRPQIDFLVYEKYDDFFCLENFAAAVSTLKEKIDLEIYDTRSFLNHHISRIEPDSSIELPFKQSAIDLLVLKRAGRIPVVSKMYNEELTDIVKNRYHEDIELYLSKFQPSKIMDEVL